MNKNCELFDDCLGGQNPEDKCKGCNSNIVNIKLSNLETGNLIMLLDGEIDNINRYSKYLSPESYKNNVDFVNDIRDKIERQMNDQNS